MIALSCVHCGLKMKVTEEVDGKRAQCPGCGRVVLLPSDKPGTRPGRKGRHPTPAPPSAAPPAPPAPPAGGGEKTTAWPAPGARDARTGTTPDIRDRPTQGDAGELSPAELTDFLAPARGGGEDGRLGALECLQGTGLVGAGV